MSTDRMHTAGMAQRMARPALAAGLVLAAGLGAAACSGGGDGDSDGLVDQAVEKTKDALDMREHEEMKDAAESAAQAAEDAGEAMKAEAERLSKD